MLIETCTWKITDLVEAWIKGKVNAIEILKQSGWRTKVVNWSRGIVVMTREMEG